MGFNIGGFLSSIAGPVLGALIPSPLGPVIGQALAKGFAPSPPGRATTPAPAAIVPVTSSVPLVATAATFSPTPISFRGPTLGPSQFVNGIRSPQRVAGALVPRALTGAGIVGSAMALFGGNGDNVSEILREARGNVRGATKNKIIAAAKACGIELAADTFGLNTSQVCQIIVAGRSRRRRGVSAADVRRTKRTIRFVNSLRKDLKKVAR